MVEVDARKCLAAARESPPWGPGAEPWRGPLALPTVKAHFERSNKGDSCPRGLRISMSRWVGRCRRHC